MNKELMTNYPGDNVIKNRNKYVGGSDIPCIFGISPFKDTFTLAKEKAGLIPVKFKGNEYTRYGQLMEPIIRDYINSVYELKFKENTNIDEEKRIRSNCDGLDLEAGLLLEIKTNATDKETYDEVYDYILQMQLYMYQFKVDKGYLVQYNRPENFWSGLDYSTQYEDKYFNQEFDENRISVLEIERDDVLITKILTKIEEFWKKIEKLKEKPDMTEEEFLFGTQVEEYKNTISKLTELEYQISYLKELDVKAKEYRDVLYRLMEKNDVKQIKTDKLSITKVESTQIPKLDTTRLKKEMPEVCEKYTKISSKKGYLLIKISGEVDVKKAEKKTTAALSALGL